MALLVMSLAAACGSDSNDDNADTGSTTTAATATKSSSGSSATTTTSTGTGTDAQVGAIGACLAENTSGDVITELRAGTTTAAEEMYTTCLEGALPAGMVDQLDPIIDSAAQCGVTEAGKLSDADVTKLEAGDEQAAEQFSTATLTCLSTELGIPLS